jgi:phosphatidylserine synthase
MTMAWNSVSLESTLAIIVAALFAIAGVINLARPGPVKRDFARWGYPAWFQLLCGALELLSAVLILGQQTRIIGFMLSGIIMIGALFTLLRHREPFQHLAPALVFSALIVATLAARA